MQIHDDASTALAEKGKLIYRNGSVENARKYNSFFGMSLSGVESEQTFILYERGLLVLPDNDFVPVELIKSITLDGGTTGTGILGQNGIPKNIWLDVQDQEERHYSLISATEGWKGELGRILLGGGSLGVISALKQLGFSSTSSNFLSGKEIYTRSNSQ